MFLCGENFLGKKAFPRTPFKELATWENFIFVHSALDRKTANVRTIL